MPLANNPSVQMEGRMTKRSGKQAELAAGRIRVGIGGWTYEPWRATFYPKGLPHKNELAHASRHLTSIEINGTFYRSQTPATFAKWRDETPDDFVFAVKAPRFIVQKRALAESRDSIQRFLESGVCELGEKLGPILWQFAPTKKFNGEDFAAFLELLPREHGGRPRRHALEVRHASFVCAEFVDLAHRHGVAIVTASDSEYPEIADATADFVYLRVMGTQESQALGYAPDALDILAARANAFARGENPEGPARITPGYADGKPRDVFFYFIGGFKQRNPAAAMALIEMLK
jgi:uncharacterized protein YecE (DUF72 family)